jgi:hypothetical protein
MPSSSKAQNKFMRAVAHGMKPRGGGGPTKSQAMDFVRADQKRGISQLPDRASQPKNVGAAIVAGKRKEQV